MTTQQPFASHYDAIVVGARCAGAATAMLLARAGLRVLDIDRSPKASDTLSTHALMRGGVLQLKRWGLLDAVRASGAPPITTTTFHYGEQTVPVDIKPRHGIAQLYAPRRTILDPLLADAAQTSGARVEHRVSLVRLLTGPVGRVHGALLRRADGTTQEVRANIVVGADGLRSKVAQLTRAPHQHFTQHTTASIYGYSRGLPPQGYQWYFGQKLAAGVIPTNNHESCVFVSASPQAFRDHLRFDLTRSLRQALTEIAPPLAAQTAARPLTNVRGFAGQVGFLRQCAGPGWALVGDASHFKDPITAHGITDALRDAELLARAIARGTDRALNDYRAERDQHAQGFLRISNAIASFDWNYEKLASLHRDLSREMNREAQMLADLDTPGSSSASSNHLAHRTSFPSSNVTRPAHPADSSLRMAPG